MSSEQSTDGEQQDFVNDPPELADEMNFEPADDDPGKRWIVLYPDDYHDFAVDVDDNVAVKVDIQQCGEILRLCSASIASMSPRDADTDDVLRDLIKELRHQLKRHRRAQDGDGDE